MRFTMHFKSKTYPLSEELTNKSRQVGSYTHPLFGMLLGSLVAFPCMTACPVLVPILPFAGGKRSIIFILSAMLFSSIYSSVRKI